MVFIKIKKYLKRVGDGLAHNVGVMKPKMKKKMTAGTFILDSQVQVRTAQAAECITSRRIRKLESKYTTQTITPT